MKVSTSRERLMQLLEEHNDSPADMSKKTGIERSSISYYLHGKREPKQDRLIAIANAYNVNPAWLMGLDVPMEPIPKPEIEKTEIDVEKAIALYSKYAQAIPAIQNAVDSLLNPIGENNG